MNAFSTTLRVAASALLCSLTLVSQQAAAVEYALPAANSRLIGENQEYVEIGRASCRERV